MTPPRLHGYHTSLTLNLNTFLFLASDKDHPNMLAWFLREEPTGQYWAKNMSEHFDAYKAEYAKVRSEDPNHPIFILDVPWITEPATPWWIKW